MATRCRRSDREAGTQSSLTPSHPDPLANVVVSDAIPAGEVLFVPRLSREPGESDPVYLARVGEGSAKLTDVGES